MHADELDIDAGLVRRLLAAQFPDRASTGLVALPYYEHTNPGLAGNASHRLGQVLAG
jgi:hypothetical protein